MVCGGEENGRSSVRVKERREEERREDKTRQDKTRTWEEDRGGGGGGGERDDSMDQIHIVE